MLQRFMCFVHSETYFGYYVLRQKETSEFREHYIDYPANI
jgi:hypothetical protein